MIPNDDKLKHLIMRGLRNKPLGAHFETAKTSEKINWHFIPPESERQIRAYVRGREKCQANKVGVIEEYYASGHKLYENTQKNVGKRSCKFAIRASDNKSFLVVRNEKKTFC